MRIPNATSSDRPFDSLAARAARARRGRRLGPAAPASGRVAVTFVLALVLGLTSVSGPAEAARGRPGQWSCQRDICLRMQERGVYLTIQVRNQRAMRTHVVIESQKLENLKPLQPLPFVARIDPGETVHAGVLAIQDPKRPHAHETSWRTLRGDPTAVHDDRWHYRMPFGGPNPRPISQGYNGRFSHKGLGAFALDFPMPWGTPVLAARAGTIVEAINDMVASGTRQGEFETDNRVVLEHRDGTFSVYAHLRHGGRARVGQRVQSGDLIGLSGDTGFSTGPHLHFEVYKIRPDGKKETLPVKFWNGTAKGFTPVAGVIYRPGCHRTANAQCAPGELATESKQQAAASPRPAAKRAARPARAARSKRLPNGACQCANGALMHVDLPCTMVCGD